MRALDRIWYGDAMADRVARGLLAPAGWAYAAVATARNALYDVGALPAGESAIPVLGLGNLTVGGTGKTPVAAWAAGRLLAAGARPAIVLRGYGGDEPLVHARLNPAAIVVADADRLRGVRRAAALNADCAILDDAFQHRRIRRMADWLLVAAERWRPDHRCIPAGPLREPASSMRRATLVVVTRKTASRASAEELAERLAGQAGGRATAVLHLAPDGLVQAHTGEREPLGRLVGRRVVAAAAVGAPEAFFDQLRGEGAIVDAVAYRDHHAFDAADVARLVQRARRGDGVVCTLKDAVKLTPLWPREGPPLWYVSQRAVIERGSAALDASLESLLAARMGIPSQTAGPAGPSSPAHGYRSSTADQ
jgi:tetraacyldisaccharide 4'-kinase